MGKENDKTQMYLDGDKTSIYGDKEKRTKESAHNISVGDQVSLNNKEYKVIELVSESSGEAVIYKIEDINKKIFALKLYYEFHQPEQEPNSEALERVQKIQDPDILNLIDFGTADKKFKGKYCYELLDFAYGLDLLCVDDLKQKYTTSFLEKEVIPQIFKGILKLHENKIYHCDLKPQNVFYLDTEQNEIVVGDYGSSKTFDYGDEKSSRKTTTVKGTDFYLPPEQARGFISEKNDYYSFGMILLHLFYPEKILTDDSKNLSRLKLKQIIERQFEAKPIIDYNPEYKRTNQIIEGLTLADFNLRWGKEEIQKWISGEDIPVVYKKVIKQEAKQLKEQSLVFGKYTLTDPEDLRNYILNDKNWYADLIEDDYNKEDFIKWMINLNIGNINVRKGFNNIIKYYSQDGIEYVSDALIRFLIPEDPLVLGAKSYHLAESDDILKTTVSAFSHLIFDLWEMSSEKEIIQFIFNFELALLHHNKNIKSVYIRKHLNRAFSLNEDLEDDPESFIVRSYSNVNKDSADKIKNFISEISADDFSMTNTSLDKDNNFHYNLTKSSTEYLKSMGIVHVLPNTNEENQIIALRYPQISDSFDDFIDKTLSIISEDIVKNHYLTNDLNTNSIEKIREDLISTFNGLINNIESDITNIEKDYSERIKNIDGFSTNLKELQNFISNPQYSITTQTLNNIKIFKGEIQNVIETDEILKNCKDKLKLQSPATPVIKEAESLRASQNYENIEKALNILTKKLNLESDDTINLKDGKHQKISIKKLKNSISYESGYCFDSLTMSPDGKYFITTDESEKFFTIYTPGINDDEVDYKKIKNSKFEVYRTIISHDGKMIACMGDDIKNIIIYDYKTGNEILKLKEKGHTVEDISFSPDGKYLAAQCDNDDYVIVLWNLENREAEKIYGDSYVFCFHPFKNLIAVGNSDDEIALIDLNTDERTILTESIEDTFDAIYFSPDGKFIISCCDDIKIWNASDGKLVYKLKGKYDYYETNCCFSSDGKYFAAGLEDERVRIWIMKSGEPVLTINELPCSCTGLAFHPNNGSLIITTNDDQFFIVSNINLTGISIKDFVESKRSFSKEIAYDETENCTIFKTGKERYLVDLAISNDGKYIAAASNQFVKVYCTEQKKLIYDHKKIKNILTKLSLSNNNKYFVYTDFMRQNAVVHDFHSGKEIHVFNKKDIVSSGIRFSNEGKYLAVSGYGTLFLDTKTWKVEKNLSQHASAEVAFHPQKQLVASMGEGKIIITDYQTWESKVFAEHSTMGNVSIQYSPSANMIALSNYNNKTIQLWDVKTAKMIRKISGYGGSFFCFSPDESYIVHKTETEKVLFINIQTGKKVLTLKNFNDINGLAYHPTDNYIVVAEKTQIALIYLKNLIVKNT